MNQINKVSDITYNDVADYIHLDAIGGMTDDEQNTLETLIKISKSFITSYTGLTVEQLDEHPDFVIVVLILCQDMWDNRTLYVDNENLNKVVDTILGMHSVNLL